MQAALFAIFYRSERKVLMRRVGRPKAENPRTQNIVIRISDDEAQLLDIQTAKMNMNRSEYLRTVIAFMDRHMGLFKREVKIERKMSER